MATADDAAFDDNNDNIDDGGRMAWPLNKRCEAEAHNNRRRDNQPANEGVAVTLIADDADGGNRGVAIVGRASLTAGGGLIN